MGSALAKQMRSPSEKGCVGWMAKKIMSMGNGADSIDAVSLIKTVNSPVIVELGPGAGYSLRKMLSDLKPSKIYGIEISDAFRKALAADDEFAASISSGVLSLHGNDATKLDFIPDNSVDIIFGFNVIYFLDPLNVYVKEMYRILKPDGQVIFGVKDIAKTMETSVYINTDWKVCLDEMKSVGFVDETLGEEKLEGPLAYTLLTAKKPQ